MPQNLWVGISESGHSTILIFTFLKSAFQTLTFGICLGSQHLKVTLSTISTGVKANHIIISVSALRNFRSLQINQSRHSKKKLAIAGAN